MNKACVIFSIVFLHAIAAPGQEQLPVIKAVNNKADYRIGTEWRRGTWTISPQIARDTLLVRSYGEKVGVAFNTDTDSISYTLKPGDTRSFIVNLNDTARALTVIHVVSVLNPLRFTSNGDEDSVRFWYGYEPGAYMEKLKITYPTSQLIPSSGGDIAAIAALLEWTHNQWKHNGNFSPKKSDAISILEEVKTGGQFPCFAFSIVLAAKLNEAGYKSRVLYLKAKTVETDKYAPGHVVTETYVPSLGKWIFLDGQFNAMPMLNGKPLNAVEFQQAITAKNDKVHFYNTVNYNGTPYTNRRYFDFVYPTLYYFDYSFDSRVDTGAGKRERIKGKTNLMLVPTGAKNPVKFGSFDGKIDYCLYTQNAKLFYRKPAL